MSVFNIPLVPEHTVTIHRDPTQFLVGTRLTADTTSIVGVPDEFIVYLGRATTLTRIRPFLTALRKLLHGRRPTEITSDELGDAAAACVDGRARYCMEQAWMFLKEWAWLQDRTELAKLQFAVKKTAQGPVAGRPWDVIQDVVIIIEGLWGYYDFTERKLNIYHDVDRLNYRSLFTRVPASYFQLPEFDAAGNRQSFIPASQRLAAWAGLTQITELSPVIMSGPTNPLSPMPGTELTLYLNSLGASSRFFALGGHLYFGDGPQARRDSPSMKRPAIQAYVKGYVHDHEPVKVPVVAPESARIVWGVEPEPAGIFAPLTPTAPPTLAPLPVLPVPLTTAQALGYDPAAFQQLPNHGLALPAPARPCSTPGCAGASFDATGLCATCQQRVPPTGEWS